MAGAVAVAGAAAGANAGAGLTAGFALIAVALVAVVEVAVDVEVAVVAVALVDSLVVVGAAACRCTGGCGFRIVGTRRPPITILLGSGIGGPYATHLRSTQWKQIHTRAYRYAHTRKDKISANRGTESTHPRDEKDNNAHLPACVCSSS